jgi:hypothetical protein
MDRLEKSFMRQRGVNSGNTAGLSLRWQIDGQVLPIAYVAPISAATAGS